MSDDSSVPSAPPADSMTSAADKAKLDQLLIGLQQSAAVVSQQILSTNRAFYRHLAELYLWWRDAVKIEGYLDTEYGKIGKKFKKKVTHGINFAPLFWLTWGYDNGLTDDKAGRWSRVLNKLHEVYEAEQQYHTDSVAKLQNFIEQKGGVDGLVDYGGIDSSKGAKPQDTPIGNDDDVPDDDSDMLPAIEKFHISTDEIQAQLYEKAKNFYSMVSAPATISLNTPIPLTEDGLGLVLVRKVGSQYQLIGTSNDVALVTPVATRTYLQDFSALPQSIRTIVETISTQCLPKHLQHFYANLEDSAKKGVSGAKAKAVRRLMYQQATGEFVLSPIRSDSGVVTASKPKQAVLENASVDAFLSTRSRRAIERRLISGRDFNWYTPSNADVVPTYPHVELASHAIRLQDIFGAGDYLHLDFWPFYTSVPAPRGQLITSDIDAGFGAWRTTLNLAWFRKFALEFTSLWLGSHGQHIKREHQNIFKLEFTDTDLTVHFVYRNDQFENSKTIDFDGVSTLGKPITVFVLTKDFAVVAQSIADLGVATPIEFAVDADVLTLRFSTTAADYQVAIPTCSVDGVRSSKHFKQYEPAPFVVDAFGSYNDQVEGDVGEFD